MPIGLSPRVAPKKRGVTTTLSRKDSSTGAGTSIGGTAQDNSTTIARPVVKNPTYSTSGAQNIGGLPATTTTGNRIAAASGSPQIQATPIIGNPAVNAAQTGAVTSAAAAAPVPTGPMPTAGGQGQYGGNTDPLTGWLGTMGYTPGDVMGNNQMPAKYLYDILQNQGMDPSGGLFYMMEPLADILMPLYEIMNGTPGQTSGGNRFTPESIGNFMGQRWQDFMTPGGRLPQQQGLINNLLGTTGTDSVLGGYLNVGTPEERVENLRKYLMLVGNLSGSPMYQQSLSNVLSQGGYGFLDQFSGGNQPNNTFGQYLQQNYGPLFGGF